MTLQAVYDEMLRLRERVEDLEDLRELNAAIARNGKKKLVAWDSAKAFAGFGGLTARTISFRFCTLAARANLSP